MLKEPLELYDMKIYNVTQGSEEWHALRIGKITGSCFSKLLGTKAAKEKYLYARAAEIVTGCRCDSDEYGGNFHTRRGNELEPLVRKRYIDFHIKQFVDPQVQEVGMVQLGEYVACSPDSFVGNDGLLEIKVPDSNNYFKQILELDKKGHDAIPEEYYMQMQFNIYVCGRSWCDYVVYNPKHEINEKAMRIHRVFRNEKVQEEIGKVLDESILQIKGYVDHYNSLTELGNG